MEPKASRDSGGPGQQPPRSKHHETVQEEGIVSWSDLNPELIGRVGRFLPVKDAQSVSSDVMNLLRCVGPGTATVVRKAYLSGNDYYLARCLRRRSERLTSYWLGHNEEVWKKRCRDLRSGSKTSETDVDSLSLYLNQVKNITLHEDCDAILCGFAAVTGCEKVAVLGRRHFGYLAVLHAVGTTKIAPGTSEAEVRSLLEREDPGEDGKTVLHLMRRVDFVFSSPALVIEHGLLDVLKYMVSEGIVGINDALPLLPGFCPPLLFHAARHSHSIFPYLLSCRGIDVNACVDEDGLKLIHYCALDLFSVAALEALLRHPNIDVDALTGTMIRTTALSDACRFLDLAKVRALLEGGANPDIVLPTFGTAADIVQARLSSEPPSDEERQTAEEVLRLLQLASSARAVETSS
eukprot:CAMPEP_0178481430 /NCGR_PEP_ID=MMETSP0696-20121128/6210_1 /TAXON_ID=265572 /ORGANISM="Extubocellulus spinifer, Strain CCMP396" /LENGTH=406 /DNA_ID=CAMNT_0020108907 /DNA_START=13 /DNA_END=1233 /DNA_ORIENTATION=-